MTFFVANCLSPKLVRMLAALGVDAVALRDFFDEDTADDEGLPQLKDTGWVLVTADQGIKKRKHEVKELRACGVSAIFLQPFWTKLDKWGQASWLIKHWQRIETTVTVRTPPE